MQAVKLALKLNFKTIFPSTLDRQKVSLVNNIFHESILAAVNHELNNYISLNEVPKSTFSSFLSDLII